MYTEDSKNYFLYWEVWKGYDEKRRKNQRESLFVLSTIVLFVDICRFLISGSAKSPLISSYVKYDNLTPAMSAIIPIRNRITPIIIVFNGLRLTW
jgi:hypothetical protein